MTKALKLLEVKMQDTERNQSFSKAVQINHELVKKNSVAYNQAKENYYSAQDKTNYEDD